MAKGLERLLVFAVCIFFLTQTGLGQTESPAPHKAQAAAPASLARSAEPNREGSQARQTQMPARPAASISAEQAQAKQPRRLTLDDAISTALGHHPSLTQARAAISAADARTKQARSGFFPQVSASGIAKQGLSGASGALGLRGLVTSPLLRDIAASAAILQNVFDFGRTAHMVKAITWASTSLKYALQAQEALVTINVQP